jgi:hypothetical protein
VANQADNAAGEFAILPTGKNGSSLTIQNTSGGLAVVDGNHLARVFDINPGGNPTAPAFGVTMSGFTITGGDTFDATGNNPDGAPATGGGIRDQNNVSLTLNTMVITNNVAEADGGGVVMENGMNIGTWTLTVNASLISNNHSGDAGGGIDTDGTGTVFINPGTVITGNSDVNQGAGVYIDTIAMGMADPGASMTMTGTVVSDNQATNVGVTGSGGGTMTIDSSTVEDNFSGGSGGGFSDENNMGTLVVRNSVFLDNSAVMDGGGIQEGGPGTMITNTVIEGNTASNTGGGLFLNGIGVSIQNTTIANNTAENGGGGLEIQTTGGGTTITNATITGNSATGNAAPPSNGPPPTSTASGGGIEAPATSFTDSLTLLNDTINGNFASGGGGGIFWGGTTGSVSVHNTIIAKNTAITTGPDANNPSGSFNDIGGNLIGIGGASGGNSGFNPAIGQVGSAGTPLDPLLGPLQNNGGPTAGTGDDSMTLPTEALPFGSPALDKGFTSMANPAPTTDERGFVRPDAGTGEKPDVGAFEFQDVTLSVSLMPASPLVFLGGSDTFAVMVTDTSGNALPADNTTVTVTLPAGLGGGTMTFTVGALAAHGSATFIVPVTAVGLGPQTVTAAVTSPDANPNRVSTSATIDSVPPPVPVIPNASVPPGTVLSFPFAAALGNPVFIILTRVKGKKFFLALVINTSGDAIAGRLLLFGLTPKQFNTGLTAFGVPALDVFLPPGGVVQLQLPLKSFFPVVIAGF